MPAIYDQSKFEQANSGWTDFRVDGTVSIGNLEKSYGRPLLPAVFNQVGSIRNGIPGLEGQVYQVDFKVTQDIDSQVFGLFGLRDDNNFIVTGPMIYIFIS